MPIFHVVPDPRYERIYLIEISVIVVLNWTVTLYGAIIRQYS
jgi:hypothetical protein